MKLQQGIQTDAKLIQEIQHCWNPQSKRTGLLVQRFDCVCHYGVALSDTLAISWRPYEEVNLK